MATVLDEVTLRGLTVKQESNGNIKITIHAPDLIKEISQITVNKSGCIHLVAEKRNTPPSKGDFTHMLPVSRIPRKDASATINTDEPDKW